MFPTKNKDCVSIATIATVTQVAFHTVQATAGNEIELPEPRDILEDVSNEVKLQLLEMA